MRRHPRISLGLAALVTLCALILACGGGGDGGGGGTEGETVSIPSTPHPVIVIDIGTLRADHLGCYGYDRATSPNVDRIATESILFEWSFGQAPMTAPAQASIFTGLYPSSHGMLDETTRLSDEATTLAEAFRDYGYKTAAFVDGGYMSEGLGFEQGFDLYDNSKGGGVAAIGPKVVEWLRANHEENFFLLVHTYDVHTPYAPPEPHRSAFLDGLPAPSEGFVAGAEEMETVRASFESGDPSPLPENDIAHAKALYDGEIHYVDSWLGEFVDLVRELGLDNQATIVVCADHGEEFQEHGSVLHEKLYTSVTRVPLIVRLPAGSAVARVSQVVEMIDLMPTLLELAGAELPAYVQGESLVPLMTGEGQPPYIAFSESPFFGGRRAVAMGGYRMIAGVGGEGAELYDLSADPLEMSDLGSGDERRIGVFARHLESWEERVASFSFAGGEEASVADETLEQLKSLGYVQ